MQLIFSLAIAIALWSIPAYIAKSKGRSFGTWYLYSFFLFPVALIHSIVMRRSDAWVLEGNAR